jgi:hypothetical protein
LSKRRLRKQATEPVYDFCLAKDRKRFYRKLRSDYQKQILKREPEDVSSIRFDIDVGPQGEGKRKATILVGHRRFQSLRRLNKFLLLTKGYDGSKGIGGKNHKINWSRKDGMCQYPKYARMVIVPVHPRGRVKILHSYRLKQPL